MKVPGVTRADVAALHHALRETPYQANRVLEILRKAFNLAEKWGLRDDGTNPCRHVEKFKERKRERLLTPDELAGLGQALDEIEREESELLAMLNLVRLLTMTGARLGEIQNLRWQDVDLEAGVLRLEDSKTGPKQIPLGGPARELLASLPRDPFNDHVCPGLKPGAPLVGVHRVWYRIRQRAGLPDLRLHDLRHAWASLAASSGLSLPIIGAVLGHRRAETTNRYSHFLQEPLKQAVDMVTGQIAEFMSRPASPPKVVPMPPKK
jgi:integrase